MGRPVSFFGCILVQFVGSWDRVGIIQVAMAAVKGQ